MIDVREPLTPGWWLNRGSQKLASRVPRLTTLVDRLEGNPPLPMAANEHAARAFREAMRKARANYPELIVQAPRERMVPLGFRTGATGTDENGDQVAAEMWAANGLDVAAADVHDMMLGAGDGYMMVGGIDADTGYPLITEEDPRQVVTFHDPARQRRVRAAVKMFHDPEQSRDLAYLYLATEEHPGEVWIAERDISRASYRTNSVRFDSQSWDWIDADRLPFNLVPVVRFRNKRGVSEFEHHTDLLDRINHMIFQRLVIATMQAFKQRAIKGLPDEDADGNEIDWSDVFEGGPDALWQVPAEVDFWESKEVNLEPILASVKDDVRELAAVTRTPMSMLSPDSANQSAEGAAFAREGLVFKTKDRIVRATEAWKDVMSIGFRFLGDEERANRTAMHMIWAKPEMISLAERADAMSKLTDLPWRDRMIDIMGYNPTEVDRMSGDRAADMAIAAALATGGQSAPPRRPAIGAAE